MPSSRWRLSCSKLRASKNVSRKLPRVHSSGVYACRLGACAGRGGFSAFEGGSERMEPAHGSSQESAGVVLSLESRWCGPECTREGVT